MPRTDGVSYQDALASFYQDQAGYRPSWMPRDPRQINVIKTYPPGDWQFGAFKCIYAPDWAPGCAAPCCGSIEFTPCTCCMMPKEVQLRFQSSRFFHVLENGVVWNFPGLKPRAWFCGLGKIWPYCCGVNVKDDVKYVTWDHTSLDLVKKERWCAACDCCTEYGICCGPYNCGARPCKCCCPCLDIWPFKVCYMTGCDERKQYCEGGFGTKVVMAKTICGGHCVETQPVCCPTEIGCILVACIGPCGSLCTYPGVNYAFVRKEDADDVVATVTSTVNQMRPIIKSQIIGQKNKG